MKRYSSDLLIPLIEALAVTWQDTKDGERSKFWVAAIYAGSVPPRAFHDFVPSLSRSVALSRIGS